MKKIIILIILLLATPVLAATTDFTAGSDITVNAVTFGTTSANMIIFNGSTAESWSYNSGVFTVTNPGSAFKVGSSDPSVKSIVVLSGGKNVACYENTMPGTSSVTLPTTAGTYTVEPSTVTNCTTLCATVHHAATYNFFPTCGAATCDSGYVLSGSGASATCVSSGAISPGGGGGSSSSTTTTPTTTATATTTATTTTTTTIITTPVVIAPIVLSERAIQWQSLINDASAISSGTINNVLNNASVERNVIEETLAVKKYTSNLLSGVKNTTLTQIMNLTNFVVYGTKNTKKLGEGERAGVVNSYKTAFGKIPTTQNEWLDCIAIATGRWPAEKSTNAEAAANKSFEKIYKRKPNISNANDNAAVIIIAYGLRPNARNTKSEADRKSVV